ncbi:SAM-dependent methyltransferase [Desulfosarcina ovata subsp. sediminis]|uniref:SAM-dependent methyltransferase n=1 Tax=Desulfosarcina ovata subsp. sediminis TaxID=885957 RepID=A0A5K8A014_9BACT|nr:class I SAM-dependent methyltransferase [Desulfosarcina ovata]BBO85734.1 SAM-dependent methyltransferase [Desulfosarcina ovata subsp. sediminis]
MSIAAYLSPEMQRAAGGTLRPGGLALTDRAMAVCRFAPGSHLLDLGCGPGATLRHLSEVHAMRTWGIDRSLQMLADAARRDPHAGRLVQASGMGIPFADRCLDGVFCECVLSLMPDPLEVLGECHRILRPAGRLVVSDLYLRRPEPQGIPMAIPGSSCLAGARDKTALLRMARDAGFTIRLWEDHTPYLTQLAVNMVFSQGSMDWFWNFMGDGPEIRKAACRSKPGYFLMVVIKGSNTDG